MISDVPVPEPGDGEVRVRVLAASVNGFDLAVAGGFLHGAMEHRFPVVLGKDFAGVLDAVGTGVEDYAVGDRVFGVVVKPFLGDGSFAEYVTVPVGVGLARIPDGVSFTQALRPGGTLVSTIAQSAEQVAAPHATFVGVHATPSPQTLDRLATHQTTQHTRVVVEHTYRLDEAPDALAHVRAGTLGKLVILVADPDESAA